jgi:hypothetical protein
MGDLLYIMNRLEQSVRAVCRKRFDASTGKSGKISSDADEESSDLYNLANVERVRQACASLAVDDEDRRQWVLAYRYLFCRTFASLVQAGARALHQEENKRELPWEGKTIPLSRARALIGTEADEERRKELCERMNVAETHLNRLREALFLQMQDQARQMGFPHYRALYEEMAGISLAPWKERMEEFLAKTEDFYRKALASCIGEGGKIPGERHQLYPLLSGRKYDPYFREIEMLPTLEDTLYGLGINILQQASIVMDVEKRSNKSPCSCIPLLVPKEVHLVVYPKGGWRPYSEILHEAGRAEFYAHIREDLHWVYKHLGDPSLPHAYGYVLQDLMINREWMEHHLEMEEAVRADFYEFSLFFKLYRWRKYAAMFLYEYDLYALHSLTGMPEHYVAWMSRATGTRYAAATFLTDILQPFSAFKRLRAWMFADQLHRQIQGKYGDCWFQNSQAGLELKQMWSCGTSRSVDEWCRILHISPDFSGFLKEVQEVWGTAEGPSLV